MDKENQEYAVSAGGIVINTSGQIALVRNNGRYWGFPKGHQEEGETLEETAKREIYEETGLEDVQLLEHLGAFRRPRLDSPTELKEISVFLAKTLETDLKPVDPEVEAQWFSLTDAVNAIEAKEDMEFLQANLDKAKALADSLTKQ